MSKQLEMFGPPKKRAYPQKCLNCHAIAHNGQCPKPGMTSAEMSAAEGRFLRGMVRTGKLPPLDPDDTRDLWRDGW